MRPPRNLPSRVVALLVVLLVMLGVAGACSDSGVGTPPPPPGGKADGTDVLVLGLYEGSPEAIAVLRVANELDEGALDVDAELPSDAAANLVAARPIESLTALDAVPRVGGAVVQRLFRYADLHGFLPYGGEVTPRGRLVAIGDLHGDLEHTRAALQLAGAIDDADRWIGGDLVVVQVGDQLDRGDGEAEILTLLDRLAIDAAEAGGALVALNGNHEIMNVQGDFRYVTDAGFTSFGDGMADGFPAAQQARAAAFLPGGPLARRLARHDVIAKVGDTLFAHAGVTPTHVDYGLSLINHEARAWMIFEGLEPPAILDAADGPVWTRALGTDADTDCALVAETLARAGARRMVIGHTVQDAGITSDCGETLYRIDVGLSSYYGGSIEVLEIEGDAVGVLYWE